MSPLSHPAQLLVEGKNDLHVILALCQKFNVVENFTIEIAGVDSGGVDELLLSIPIRLKIARLRALGIVIDADQNSQGRWNAVRQRLIDFDYQHVPERPNPEGTIIQDDSKPRVGVWLMPNNELPGMLEDFVSYLIPDNDSLTEKAQATLNQIEAEDINLYPVAHRPKAFIHTWLAWQENPGQPMGTSITSSVLKKESPIALSFVKWISQTFEI